VPTKQPTSGPKRGPQVQSHARRRAADVPVTEVPEPDDELTARMRAIKRPQSIMSREREQALTRRQRELLDRLGAMFDDGFADLTMAELAARLNCSLRTLYLLAPSRDELVLTVVDRSLWKAGRSARDVIQPGMGPLEALRVYLEATTFAVVGWTEEFSRDLAAVPSAQELRDEHDEYLFAVTCTLLDIAVERGEVGEIDTAAVGRILSTLGRTFTRPEIMHTLTQSPQEASSDLLDLIVLGLRARAGQRQSGTRNRRT
jgi:AcrR family transcriptional regulator